MATVTIVEDDSRVCDAVRILLGASPHTLAAAHPTLAAARKDLAARTPDILLLDLGLPDGGGADLLRELHAKKRLPRAVIVMTIFDDDAHIFDALRAGATGYLLKDEIVARLLAAIDEGLGGGAPMSPSIARRVLESFRPAAAARPDEGELTPREREVVQLLAEGATYEEIGQILRISTNTVRAYIRTTYQKLQVSSKAEVAAEAVRRGWVKR
jgi:DNA-binding NarL/FixJ family response regulator